MSPQLYTYVRSARQFFARHHPVIFITTLCLAISAAVLSLSQVLALSADTTDSAPTSTIQGFNKKTVDSIKQLRISSEDNESIKLPSPRPNPFAE